MIRFRIEVVLKSEHGLLDLGSSPCRRAGPSLTILRVLVEVVCPVCSQCRKYHEEEGDVGMSSRAGDVSVLVASSSGLHAYEVT